MPVPAHGSVASAGDSGYGVAYPAASQYVTSVGGTSLVQTGVGRSWARTLLDITIVAGSAAVASGADSRGGLPGGNQRPRATAFAPEDPAIMGLMQRSILEAGHSSQHMTTRCGAGCSLPMSGHVPDG